MHYLAEWIRPKNSDGALIVLKEFLQLWKWWLDDWPTSVRYPDSDRYPDSVRYPDSNRYSDSVRYPVIPRNHLDALYIPLMAISPVDSTMILP